MIREVAGQKALTAIRGMRSSPGADVNSDAEIDAWIRQTAETIYHPVGTCRMGVAGRRHGGGRSRSCGCRAWPACAWSTPR